MHSKILALLAALFVLSATAQAAPSAAEMARSVTIERDGFGVPHIEGPSDASVVFGLGYAQAEDNFPLLEDTFIRALGRAAEVHGETGVRDDQMAAALEIVPLAQAEYRNSTGGIRAIYDAYAAGINFYIEQRRPAVVLLNHAEPWFPLAVLRYMYHLREFVGYAGLDPADMRPALEPSEPAQGSNAWAIAPSRTTSGAAMLFINPHIGYFGPAQYYEAHLISDEGWNFSGPTRYGFPFPYMGHNEALGWGHTDNYPDTGDLYVEHFDDPARPLAYRYGHGWRTATDTTYALRVRVGDHVDARHFTIRRTHHGPIVSVRDGHPLSIRLSRLRETGWFDQWYAMTKAHDLQTFRRALSRGAIAYMNIVYADRDGNIMYVDNGAVPRRALGFDYSQPVDGSDPRVEWHGYHRFDELPQVLNPPSGFVQNTNSSPFFTTSGADNPRPEAFPAYMSAQDRINPRARISHEILEGDRRFSFEDWAHATTDTKIWEAGRLIPELRDAFASYAAANPEAGRRLQPVMTELVAWDQLTSLSSVATTVFVRWFVAMRTAEMPEDPAQRFALLDQTRAALEQANGTWRMPWGEANRVQRTHWSGEAPFDDDAPSLPVLGAPGWAGIVFNFYTAPPSPHGRGYGRMGNSYVSVVEFGASTRARSIVYFGQSGDPQSPHYFDQAPLMARGEYKPAPTTLAEVHASAARSYHPGD